MMNKIKKIKKIKKRDEKICHTMCYTRVKIIIQSCVLLKFIKNSSMKHIN